MLTALCGRPGLHFLSPPFSHSLAGTSMVAIGAGTSCVVTTATVLRGSGVPRSLHSWSAGGSSSTALQAKACTSDEVAASLAESDIGVSASPPPPKPARRVPKPVGPPLLKLTDKAKARIAEIMERDHVEGLRIKVKKGGCSGFEFDIRHPTGEKTDRFDIVIQEDGVKVTIDATALLYIDGAVLDIEEVENVSTEFVIKNKKLEMCGCGASFGALIPQELKPQEQKV